MKTAKRQPHRTLVSDQIVSELARIARSNRHELVQRKAVVRFAHRNPTSAIGLWFKDRGAWDEAKMAERGRLALAGELIRVYYVDLPDEAASERYSGSVRGLLHLPSDREHGGGVRFIGSILRDDKRRTELVAKVLDELEAVKRKYKAIAALAAVWSAIDETRRQNIAPTPARIAS